MLTEHVAVAPVPARVHVPPGVKVTVPVEVDVVPVDVSLTVAVHDAACPMKTVGGLQDTVVVVVWNAPNVNVPVLVACVASPL